MESAVESIMIPRLLLLFIAAVLLVAVKAVYITCESDYVETCFDEDQNCYNCTKGTYIPFPLPTSHVILLTTERLFEDDPSTGFSDSGGSSEIDANSDSGTSSVYSSTASAFGGSSISDGFSDFLPAPVSAGFGNVSPFSASGGFPRFSHGKPFDGLSGFMRQQANVTSHPPLFIGLECSTVTPMLDGAAAMSATSRFQSEGTSNLCNAIFDFEDETSSVIYGLDREGKVIEFLVDLNVIV
ncbi:unnamed protein product [Agarophyton chilense]